MRKKLQNIGSLLVFFIFLILWESAVKLFSIQDWILPGPLKIVSSLWNAKELIIYHSLPTIYEAISGLLIAIFVSIGISIIMYYFRFLQKILYPYLILSQTIPFITLAPLLTIWFGFGILAKVIIIALVCFFPITINLFDGFRSVDSNMERFMYTMGATKWQLFRFVILPSSLPSFFSGLRIAAAYCILGAVISEWVGTDRGLGILLVRSSKSYLTDRVFATVFVITILSLTAVFIVESLARLIIPWHYIKKNSYRGGSNDE